MENQNDFGDFEEVKYEENISENSEEPIPTRIRLPRGKELIGRIVQRFGGNRMDIKSTDGKVRNCRVPGRYRRRLWLRPKDIVIIIPWEFDDGKGDIIYKYRPIEITILNKKGLLNTIKDEF
ncbi:MAG: translation initiation factor IF-1A [Candidatus Pacearchaeota archaeon]|nr:translation initiation factor IF-1A [Candidatus Pacearchaeota archaeon]